MHYLKVRDTFFKIFVLTGLNLVFIFLNSGGIKRTWTGVPRKLQTLDENGKVTIRCACIQLERLSEAELAHIVQYDDCDASSATCYVKVD